MLNIFGKKIKLKPKIKNLKLKNPVLTASGTCGYGVELQNYFNVSKIGGIVLKGTTPVAKRGNENPRIWEYHGGIINSIGLQNPGIDEFIDKTLPELKKLNTEIILNIAGSSVEDYVKLAQKTDELEGIFALELNISCPNVKKGGIAFGQIPELSAELVSKCRKVTSRPLIVKLTPNVTDISKTAIAVEQAGADAVTCINTFRGLLYDLEKDDFALKNIVGGVSGPAIKPMALLAVYECARKIQIPVIGVGGIFKKEDALEFLKVGASCVQLGTMMLSNPHAPEEVADYLKEVL
ncbi:MAG: dihydroorotate dehydrogenase [Candidatus Muiribacteriota bacterium]